MIGLPKLISIDDFNKLKEKSCCDIEVRLKAGTRIMVGMGTCGIAAGAQDTMQALLAELTKRRIEAAPHAVPPWTAKYPGTCNYRAGELTVRFKVKNNLY